VGCWCRVANPPRYSLRPPSRLPNSEVVQQVRTRPPSRRPIVADHMPRAQGDHSMMQLSKVHNGTVAPKQSLAKVAMFAVFESHTAHSYRLCLVSRKGMTRFLSIRCPLECACA
jgi:hypothetical protein